MPVIPRDDLPICKNRPFLKNIEDPKNAALLSLGLILGVQVLLFAGFMLARNYQRKVLARKVTGYPVQASVVIPPKPMQASVVPARKPVPAAAAIPHKPVHRKPVPAPRVISRKPVPAGKGLCVVWLRTY
ncbi:hypothetical protein LTR70_009973 [Exophiala xenobiotica]|uniref:Uncharacterized protein n=1 Tax=Lithohypha guttulata TaxID=1690604 RepID=A0ABR0KKP0_9EURO|nr:hypothetical protein LTR24_001555 [Lithohypha guttulata]KAK5309803.1 hypothetical protein LTR70_009973 [Exophiala xenobiotica]